jgi:hypothetical protein
MASTEEHIQILRTAAELAAHNDDGQIYTNIWPTPEDTSFLSRVKEEDTASWDADALVVAFARTLVALSSTQPDKRQIGDIYLLLGTLSYLPIPAPITQRIDFVRTTLRWILNRQQTFMKIQRRAQTWVTEETTLPLNPELIWHYIPWFETFWILEFAESTTFVSRSGEHATQPIHFLKIRFRPDFDREDLPYIGSWLIGEDGFLHVLDDLRHSNPKVDAIYLQKFRQCVDAEQKQIFPGVVTLMFYDPDRIMLSINTLQHGIFPYLEFYIREANFSGRKSASVSSGWARYKRP